MFLIREKTMFHWSLKLSKNYALDLSCLHIIRELNDGLTYFEAKINYDKYIGDHNPSITIILIILNLKIFEINTYNVNHTNI